MSTTTQHIITRSAISITIAGVLLGVGGAAHARQDAGPTVPPDFATCGLARVGTQFVSCDDLTGHDVPAPLWIPER